MHRKQIIIALYTGLTLVTAPAAWAEDKDRDPPGFFERVWQGTKNVLGVGEDEDRGKPKDQHKEKSRADDRSASLERDVFDAIFGEDEKNIIRAYYGESGKKQKPIPPGLKKKVERGGQLPPGWQKKVARGEVLPEDVYRYSDGIPDDLYRRLPRHPDGTSIRVIDNKVVRMIDATRAIIDVFDL